MLEATTDIDAMDLNRIRDTIHAYNVKKGWWTDAGEDTLKENDPELWNTFERYRVATKIALIHSEISEALEGVRKNKMDDHLHWRKAVDVELADALIRIFDLCGRLNINIGDALVEKDHYNHDRADHKLENREKIGGKKF